MRNMITRIFSFSGLVLLIFLLAGTASAEDIRGNLFAAADNAVKAANEARAHILAPDNYSKATAYYKSAEDKLSRKKSLEGINSDLEKAVKHLRAAVAATRVAEVSLASEIQARNDAESAEAEKYAAEEWQEAEELFAEAARRLEGGNINSAKRKGADANGKYRAAELAAIKNNYLAEARRLIELADKQKVKKLAPKTLEQARSLLADAEKKLNSNRYDTDEARSLARQAKYQAKHALYLNEVLQGVKDKELSLEDFALSAEKPLERVGSALDMVVEFDSGLDKPTKELVASIERLRKDSFELSERRDEIMALESELRLLEQKLGTQSNRMKQQEEIRRKFVQTEAMFDSEEASVYRQGNNVVIRMVGLNFDSGKSVISSQYFVTLRKVIDAMRIFPNSEVTIEGHTDSFGGDASNLVLSQKRADAVLTYLQANMNDLQNQKITAVGFGESRPVANNETAEGRKRNRRIDLLIKPIL